jgi:hypothetical protein
LEYDRKSVEEIREGEQIAGVSNIVRFAPSACNSQPWYVKNKGGAFDLQMQKARQKRDYACEHGFVLQPH